MKFVDVINIYDKNKSIINKRRSHNFQFVQGYILQCVVIEMIETISL